MAADTIFAVFLEWETIHTSILVFASKYYGHHSMFSAGKQEKTRMDMSTINKNKNIDISKKNVKNKRHVVKAAALF